MESKYIHTTDVHNTKAAEVIVPLILERFNISSVVDVGCGIGTWLSVFHSNGIMDYIGIDGDYVDMKMLTIPYANFMSADLNKEFTLPRRFSAVLCLEVAEHLSPYSSETFVRSLTNLGDIIIFSAAIPGQEGQNHLNEQYPNYWLNLFQKYGFTPDFDIRPEIWNNEKVEWWYRQNIIILTKDNANQSVKNYAHFIHPHLYQKKISEITTLQVEIKNLIEGKIHPMTAFKIFLKSAFKGT